MSVPAPLDMTDTEMLDWMNEYCDTAEADEGRWLVGAWDLPVKQGQTIREAICLAAAYHKEANE